VFEWIGESLSRITIIILLGEQVVYFISRNKTVLAFEWMNDGSKRKKGVDLSG
jgi:hypothetical protein